MKKTICCISFLLIIALMISITGTHMADASSFTESNPIGEYNQREYKAIEQYNVLLNYWTSNKEFTSSTNGDYPEFYGGAYINQDKCLIIQVTRLDADVYSYFNSLIDLNEVSFELVKYPFSKLIEERDIVSSKMNPKSSDKMVSEISGVGILVKENSIVVSLKTIPKEDLPEYEEQFRSTISSFDNVVFESEYGESVLTSPNPGESIGSVSVGFWATDNTTGALGIVSAGHAFSVGNSVYVNSVSFGSCTFSYYGGYVDAAFIQRTNSSFVASNYINGAGRTLKSHTVAFLPVGATVYAKGVATGNTILSGTVTTLGYDTGLGLTNAVRTTIISNYGNSGGIVFVPSSGANMASAAGIISGMNTTTHIMYYSEAGYIVNMLGVSVY